MLCAYGCVTVVEALEVLCFGHVDSCFWYLWRPIDKCEIPFIRILWYLRRYLSSQRLQKEKDKFDYHENVKDLLHFAPTVIHNHSQPEYCDLTVSLYPVCYLKWRWNPKCCVPTLNKPEILCFGRYRNLISGTHTYKHKVAACATLGQSKQWLIWK